jgi:hypothetical protein
MLGQITICLPKADHTVAQCHQFVPYFHCEMSSGRCKMTACTGFMDFGALEPCLPASEEFALFCPRCSRNSPFSGVVGAAGEHFFTHYAVARLSAPPSSMSIPRTEHWTGSCHPAPCTNSSCRLQFGWLHSPMPRSYQFSSVYIRPV